VLDREPPPGAGRDRIGLAAPRSVPQRKQVLSDDRLN